MTRFTAHPAAEEFPLMPDDRLRELADDIKRNGQREPIKLYGGKIIDGRNRLKACELLGIEPVTVEMPSHIDPYAYVWSLNGARRDLTAEQRYLIWKSCNEQSEAWRAEQQLRHTKANRKRSEAAKAQHEVSNPRVGEKVISGAPTTCGRTKRNEGRSQTAKIAAIASKTNRGSVERMERLSRERPDLAEQVKRGTIPAATALREVKREAVIRNLEDISAREAKAVSGVYDVMATDPVASARLVPPQLVAGLVSIFTGLERPSMVTASVAVHAYDPQVERRGP